MSAPSRQRHPLPAVITAALIALASLQIASTHRVYSQTIDEALHVATGLEWLQRGSYTLQPENPPLSRIAIALGPHLAGLKAIDSPPEQRRLLHSTGAYRDILARARAGTLIFFIAAAAIVFFWTRQLFDVWTAGVACGLFATLPPILAHSGLATTDMAATATVCAAFFALARWLDRPTGSRAALLGLAIGLALASKFSAYLFLCSGGFLLTLVWRLAPSKMRIDPRARTSGLIGAVGVAALVVWAVYRFSIGPVLTAADRPHRFIDSLVTENSHGQRGAYQIIEASYPAPEHWHGLERLRSHSARGHRSYLLGESYPNGHPAFFPIALMVKTPLPFLALCVIGMATIARSRDWAKWAPALAAVTILAAVLPSTISIGLRHVLPIYPLLSIVAGAGAVRLWRSRRSPLWTRLLVVTLLAWQGFSTSTAHPDYLPWFNALAGKQPEKILIDSDLDWGQDLLRLEEELARREIESVSLALFTSARLDSFNFPSFRELGPGEQAGGWVAASLMRIKGWRDHAWLESHQPVARVGASILLYHLPPLEPSQEATP
ncbi:MAG: glycosyltransferase family 39 protein [Acidobacteriota bacterium]